MKKTHLQGLFSLSLSLAFFFFFYLGKSILFVFFCRLQLENKQTIKMHLLARSRLAKLHSGRGSCSTPLWCAAQPEPVSAITWLIKPTTSGCNDHIQLPPCFTLIMNHLFEVICYGNVVIFPLSWEGKWAIVIFLLSSLLVCLFVCVCVCVCAHEWKSEQFPLQSEVRLQSRALTCDSNISKEEVSTSPHVNSWADMASNAPPLHPPLVFLLF